MQDSPMIVLRRGDVGSTPARVLEEVRERGPLSREEICAGTGLSGATVARTATALTRAGMLRERPDLVPAGTIGRPGLVFDLDDSIYAVLGVHIGRRVFTVALGTLSGTVLAARTLTRRASQPVDSAALAAVGAELLASQPGRVPLGCGLVAPWRDLPLDPDQTAAELQDELGLDVSTADHIAAIAAAEYLRRDTLGGHRGVTAYLYARDTLGFALAVDKGTQTEVSRVGMLAHFPAGTDVPCPCGRTGCAEVSISDHHVAARAHEAGVVETPQIEAVAAAALAGDAAAHRILLDRARVLGRVAASVRDMLDPDRLILVGQGFTQHRPVLDEVFATFAAETALPLIPVAATRLGSGVQAGAAITIGLAPVYDRPLDHALTPDRLAASTVSPAHRTTSA